MEWNVTASGTASGEILVRGRRSAPEGEARLTARDGKYQGVPYDRARVDTRWGPRVAEVTAGEAEAGGGRVHFRGTVTSDGVYDGSAEMEDVDLGALAPAPSAGVAYGGRLSGRAVLQGTLTRPRLVASLRSPRLFVGDEGIGALEARLSGAGDGRVAIDGTCRSARVDLALAGTVGADAPYEADLRLTARSTSVDPYVRVVQPALTSALSIVASGEARIRGPLARPAEVRAEATVPELQVLLPEFASRASEPVRLTYADGRVDVGRFHLAGEGTDLVVTGGADLVGDGPLAVSARGQADLRAASFVSRRLRGSGAARLAVDVSGTRAAPRVAGTLELEGAGLRVRGFPHGVEGLRGRLRFNEKAAALEGVSGTLAGGRLTIEGEAAYANGRLVSYDVRPVGRGMALRYPEGLRSVVDAQLRLFGDASRQWITGTVDVRQALWTRRYDVASEILAGRKPALAPGEGVSLEEVAQLDLRVRVPGTLRIDNNLASLTARADVAIGGTTRAPVVTGRAEIERGQLYFQGRTYLVQRGTLDFVNPQRLDPLFDIEAVTRIRSYSVTLRVSGTLERVTPTLTSDPPLSSLQILALLAGQDESEVASLTQAQAQERQGRLAATGAATLAAGRISESVGLEREAERLFGLNRFSIDPSLLRGAGTDPDRPRHRRQALRPEPERALLAGPARHRRADPRGRVHPLRPLLAPPHPHRPRHREDGCRARLGVRRAPATVLLMGTSLPRAAGLAALLAAAAGATGMARADAPAGSAGRGDRARRTHRGPAPRAAAALRGPRRRPAARPRGRAPRRRADVRDGRLRGRARRDRARRRARGRGRVPSAPRAAPRVGARRGRLAALRPRREARGPSAAGRGAVARAARARRPRRGARPRSPRASRGARRARGGPRSRRRRRRVPGPRRAAGRRQPDARGRRRRRARARACRSSRARAPARSTTASRPRPRATRCARCSSAPAAGAPR